MKRTWALWSAGALLGAIAGLLWYRYVGCNTGSCPLTSTPVGSTLQGSVLGVLLVNFFVPERGTAAAGNTTTENKTNDQ